MKRTTWKYVSLIALLACACEKGAGAKDSINAQASGAKGSAVPARETSSTAISKHAARRRILFIGTSITAGYGLEPESAYPQQIQTMLDSAGLDYQVVGAGESGETSSGLVTRLDWLLRQKFDVVVVETGANDGLRGVPIATMRDNIQTILERLHAAQPDARIALVQMEALPNLGRDYTLGFHEVFPDLARKNGVVLFPFLLDGVAGRRELNQADGIHPNDEGERIVARNVWKALRPLLQ